MEAYRIQIDQSITYGYLDDCWELSLMHNGRTPYKYIITSLDTFVRIKNMFQTQQRLSVLTPIPINAGMAFYGSTIGWRKDIDQATLLFCNDPAYDYDDFDVWVKEVRAENEAS